MGIVVLYTRKEVEYENLMVKKKKIYNNEKCYTFYES